MSAPSSPPSARKSVVAVDEIASMLIQLLSPGPRARPCGLIARTGLRDHILKYSSEFNCRHDVRRNAAPQWQRCACRLRIRRDEDVVSYRGSCIMRRDSHPTRNGYVALLHARCVVNVRPLSWQESVC